jgi:hypothetical protein
MLKSIQNVKIISKHFRISLFFFNLIKYIELICFVISRQSLCLSRESTRLRLQLHQTLPPRPETPYHSIQNHPYKNFFENVFPQAVQDQSGTIRSSILQMFHTEYLSSDLTCVVNYINQRYPRIQTPRKQEKSRHITTNLGLQRENSKTEIHQLLNLFDPNLRPKAEQPKIVLTQPAPIPKPPVTFKRISAKLTVIAALSRAPIPTKSGSLVTTTATK